MSEGALDRKTFEAIEAYLLDTMSADERARFKDEMARDATLRAEVELQRENMMAVELGGLTRTLHTLANEHTTERTERGNSRRYWMYAAASLLLVLCVAWWATRSPLNERLFAEHFVADPGLPVEMGLTADPAFADAMVAYKLGDHAEARTKWSHLLEAHPQNDTLIYYIASAALAMGDAEAAITGFKRVAAEPTSAFHDKSRWYLFLAYLRQGDKEKAWELNMDRDAVYGGQARAIKSEWKD